MQLGEWVVRAHDPDSIDPDVTDPDIAKAKGVSARPFISAYNLGTYRPTRSTQWDTVCDQTPHYKDAYMLHEIYKVGSFLEARITACSPSSFIFLRGGLIILKITSKTGECTHNPLQSRDYKYSFSIEPSSWSERQAATKERRDLTRRRQAQEGSAGEDDTIVSSSASADRSETVSAVLGHSVKSKPGDSPTLGTSSHRLTSNGSGSIDSKRSLRSSLSTLGRHFHAWRRARMSSYSGSTLNGSEMESSGGSITDGSGFESDSGYGSVTTLEPAAKEGGFWGRIRRR